MSTIRRATLDDLPAIAHLFDLYRIFYRKSSDIHGATVFLESRIRNNESIIFLAEESNEPVGFVQLYPQFSSTRMSRFWLLNDLYVLENYRGKGISKQLIDAAKNLTRETQATGLLLETEKMNHIGNQLYPATGFKIYNETNFYWWENK